MKNLLILLFTVGMLYSADAQLKLPPSGANQKCVVAQYMGAHAYVKVVYNSPDVTGPQGEDRKGQIWGQLVPYGMNNLGFGLSTEENPSPWRAGANETTKIVFSHDVSIEGEDLKAGAYGLHLVPQEEGPWTLILSNKSDSWGSYYYEPKDDALRVSVTPEDSEFSEWLSYEFTDRQENSCELSLKWENIAVPIRIDLKNPSDIYVAYLREQMELPAGFTWAMRDAAANYCLQNEVNLKEALAWQQQTISNPFFGSENIQTLQTLAGLQMKMDQKEDALATFEKAAKHPTANVFQVHQMGRQLIAMDEKQLALEMFEYNVERHGDVWPVNVGLARGHAALGNYDKALKYAELALERAPDQLNKDNLTNMIGMLKEKKDIN